MPRGRRTAWLAVALALTLTGGAVAATLSGNRRAARRDAASLLGKLRLPPGTVHLFAEPHGDHAYLKPMPALAADQARAVRHEWWEVPDSSPTAVISYVEAHPPAGGTLLGWGSEGNLYTGTSALDVEYSWPGVPGKLGGRYLWVVSTELPGSKTGILEQTQSDWIVPRSPSERVPAGVHQVDVTVADVDGPVTKSLTVTSGSKVRRIIAFIDGLPIVQPEWFGCPAETETGAQQITLSFLSAADAPPPALAQAGFTSFRGWQGDSGPCNPVTFSILGRAGTSLIGGEYVKSLQRILHTSL